MIRRFLANLRDRHATIQYQRNRTNRIPDLTIDEAHAVTVFRALGAQTDIQHRARQAAQLEAFGVTEPVLNACLRIQAQGAITGADLNYLAHNGIKLGFSNHLNEVAETSEKLVRLQRAVKQLAFIAGPGFTTDHVIDEGIIYEGDI